MPNRLSFAKTKIFLFCENVNKYNCMPTINSQNVGFRPFGYFMKGQAQISKFSQRDCPWPYVGFTVVVM